MMLGELNVAGRTYDGCTILGSDKFFCVVGYLDGGKSDPNKYINRYLYAAREEEHLSTNLEEKLRDPRKVFLSYYNVVDEGKFTQKTDLMGGASITRILPSSACYGLIVRGLSNIVVDPRYRKRAKFGTMIFGHCTDVASKLYDAPADAVAFGTSNPWVIDGVVPRLNAEPYNYSYVPVGERMRSDGRRKVREFMFFEKSKDDFLEGCELANSISPHAYGLFNAPADRMKEFMDAGINTTSIKTLKKEHNFLKSFLAAKDLYIKIKKDCAECPATQFVQHVDENRNPERDIPGLSQAASALYNEFAFLPRQYQYILGFLDSIGCADPDDAEMTGQECCEPGNK